MWKTAIYCSQPPTLQTYKRFWVYVKVAVVAFWILYLFLISAVYEYEFCFHYCFSTLYIGFVFLFCLDAQYTLLAVVGITKGILDTNKMNPYIRYQQKVFVVTSFAMVLALIMSVPFWFLCPYLRIGPWYLLSYTTLYHAILLFGFLWFVINAFAAWKINRYRKRKEHLIEKVGCIFITRQVITELPEGTESDEEEAVVAGDEGLANIFLPDVNLPVNY